jgi:hypothetical protein
MAPAYILEGDLMYAVAELESGDDIIRTIYEVVTPRYDDGQRLTRHRLFPSLGVLEAQRREAADSGEAVMENMAHLHLRHTCTSVHHTSIRFGFSTCVEFLGGRCLEVC